MSEKTKEVPQLADATYAHTLVIKSTHEIQGRDRAVDNVSNL